MAQSPSHKFGQIIGDVLEAAVEPLLHQFAQEHKLYLDKKGSRPARSGRKVIWTDNYGNAHELDFVLERGGNATQIGIPVAFVETAWRRYTKHSRNKAQEIQGAILPLVTTHENAAPFIGVILAGVFTDNALDQLRSLGFTVLYFDYDTVIKAFHRVGIDAYYDEDTPDLESARKVHAWEMLTDEECKSVADTLVEINSQEVQRFLSELTHTVTRKIETVLVLPLHGTVFEWNSVEEAIAFIKNYDEGDHSRPMIRYEIEIRYNNGDRIEGQFANRDNALKFLHTYQRPALRPAQ